MELRSSQIAWHELPLECLKVILKEEASSIICICSEHSFPNDSQRRLSLMDMMGFMTIMLPLCVLQTKLDASDQELQIQKKTNQTLQHRIQELEDEKWRWRQDMQAVQAENDRLRVSSLKRSTISYCHNFATDWHGRPRPEPLWGDSRMDLLFSHRWVVLTSGMKSSSGDGASGQTML